MQDKEDLIEKFLARTISDKERKMLKKWVLNNKENLDFFRKQIQKRSKNSLYHHFDDEKAFESFVAAINHKKTSKVFPKRFMRYAAVFIGLCMLGFIGHQYLEYNTRANALIEVSNSQEIDQNNVVISLADGTTKHLTHDGMTKLVDKTGNTVATAEANGLDFRNSTGTEGHNLVFNEIYVPYGQTFKLTLSDGTKVWLNAGTRLKFPQHLNSNTQNRIVYLDGEAYFDVTKDEKRPFIVNAENLDIKVLGTQFNVSAYKSDGKIATTLVEGSVNVYEKSNPDTMVLLTPSYQAAFDKRNGNLTSTKVDTQIYTSWMENKLIIDNLTFQEILDKLERMHNVSIINKAKNLNEEKFKGEFENEDIETVLRTISSSTSFYYTIDKNVITISK